jgi:hypothetical protein
VQALAGGVWAVGVARHLALEKGDLLQHFEHSLVLLYQAFEIVFGY